jgi:hypothetical protein
VVNEKKRKTNGIAEQSFANEGALYGQNIHARNMRRGERALRSHTGLMG